MNDMRIRTSLDITAKELAAYFRNYRNANPQRDDYPRLMEDAVHERWPLASLEQACTDAFCNTLARGDEDALRDAAADPESWIRTHPNGDLFAGSEYELPRQFLVDGKKRAYYEISLTRAREFYANREASKRTQAQAYEAARREAEQQADQCARMKAQCDRDIAAAVAAGLNPDEVRFAKAD